MKNLFKIFKRNKKDFCDIHPFFIKQQYLIIPLDIDIQHLP